jgi:hypothetical protein
LLGRGLDADSPLEVSQVQRAGHCLELVEVDGQLSESPVCDLNRTHYVQVRNLKIFESPLMGDVIALYWFQRDEKVELLVC